MLAQFMTIQGKGGSYALSKNQSEVFINSLRGYIAQIVGIINGEAVPRLFAINGEGTTDRDHYLPRITFSEFVKDDITEFFGALQKSIEMGLFEVTPQVQSKAGQVLGIDISGQEELLTKRREQADKLQNMESTQPAVAESDNPDEVPDTTASDITDPTLKSILAIE
jgi:phage gp29-like protein